MKTYRAVSNHCIAHTKLQVQWSVVEHTCSVSTWGQNRSVSVRDRPALQSPGQSGMHSKTPCPTFFVAIISAGTKSKLREERVHFILQLPGPSRHCRKSYNYNYILFITELWLI